MATKLRQLAALMAARDLFGPEPDRDEQVLAVRERWARIRQALRADRVDESLQAALAALAKLLARRGQ